MEMVASLEEIEQSPQSIFVIQGNPEKCSPVRHYTKGQLSYVEGGLVYVHCENSLLVVSSRQYVWIPAGMKHSLTMAQNGTNLRSIFFTPDGDEQHLFYNAVGIYPITDLLYEMLRFTERWQGHVLPYDERFVFLQSIKNILPQISNKHFTIALPYTENVRLREVIAYIEQNLADKHTLETISKRFRMSERTLSRLFRNHLKTSFLQYVKLLRVVKAFKLIQQKEHSLSEIAYQLGYQSLASFSYAFYQVTKMRPSEFSSDNPEY